MPKLTAVNAVEVLDSRGEPTVHASVTVQGGGTGEAKVPSGSGLGSYEAMELRDHDEKRYRGKGVQQAVQNIRGPIAAALLGKDTANQRKIDLTLIELDGTPQKKKLGGNATLAVSMAVARAEAASQGLPLYLYLQQLFPKREPVLPVPQMNVINGGKHGRNGLSIQEYQIIPVGSTNFAEALRMGAEVYFELRELLVKEGFDIAVGDEGGFSPKLKNSEAAFALLIAAIEKAGYVPGVDVFLAIDAAANEFYEPEVRQYRLDGSQLSVQDLSYTYKTWRERYPLISVEDPFAEDAWETWSHFTKSAGTATQVVGDDLYVTSAKRIQQGVVQGATNAVLIKPNQAGTLTETLQAVLIAQEAKQNVVVSHRAGETEDAFIADLAVAVGAGQIKTGAPSRSDRTAKYNRLLQIEAELKAPLGHNLAPFLAFHQPKYQAAVRAGAPVL